MTAQQFYEENATNVVDIPRPGHPEDPSGWAGVRRASEARFIAKDCPVMTLADAFDFAEKYCAAVAERAIKAGYEDGWKDCDNGSYSDVPHVTVENLQGPPVTANLNKEPLPPLAPGTNRNMLRDLAGQKQRSAKT